MALKPGDPVTGTCQEVDNLPTRMLGLSGGALTEIVGTPQEQKGQLFLSSRKAQYQSDLAAQGLTICEDFHPFAAAQAPLRLALHTSGATFYLVGFGPGTTFDAARFLTSGALDTAFGTGGLVTYNGASNQSTQTCGAQSDGKLLMVAANLSTFVVIRFNTDGTVDKNFGSSGVVSVTRGPAGAGLFQAKVRPDGSGDVVLCYTTGPGGRLTFTTWDKKGTLKSTVTGASDPGWVAYLASHGASESYSPLLGFAVLADGGFAAAEFVSYADGIGTTHVWNADGSFRARVVTNFTRSTTVAGDLAAQADGKFIQVVEEYKGNSLALVRYTAAGATDFSKTFADATIAQAGGALGVGSDGKITAADWQGAPDTLVVAQFNADGTLNTAFGTGGVETAPISFPYNSPVAAVSAP